MMLDNTKKNDSIDIPPEGNGSSGGEVNHAQRIEKLFREHNQALLQFLVARLHSEQEAKEVAQEAYVRMLKLEELDTVSFLRAFLFKTAINLANDRHRQRVRREQIDELVFFDITAVSPSPETGLAAKQELDVVRRAVEELPAKCRMVFVLHKFRDVSIEDIATEMELTTRMVRLYLSRALEYCRDKLEEECGNKG